MSLPLRRLPRYRTPPIPLRSAQVRCWVAAVLLTTGAMVAVLPLWWGQGQLMPRQEAYDQHHDRRVHVAWVLPVGCASAAAWRSTVHPWTLWRCSRMHVPPRVPLVKPCPLLTKACPSPFHPNPLTPHDGPFCVGAQKLIVGSPHCRPRCVGDTLDVESQTNPCTPWTSCT